MIKLKRAYEQAGRSDGARWLVDRMWPRGVTKEALKLDGWVKEVAPSTELRKWFGHDPAKWEEFRKRYKAELKEHAEDLKGLKAAAKKGTVTLVFGAKDEEHNNAVVLKEMLEGRGK